MEEKWKSLDNLPKPKRAFVGYFEYHIDEKELPWIRVHPSWRQCLDTGFCMGTLHLEEMQKWVAYCLEKSKK